MFDSADRLSNILPGAYSVTFGTISAISRSVAALILLPFLERFSFEVFLALLYIILLGTINFTVLCVLFSEKWLPTCRYVYSRTLV